MKTHVSVGIVLALVGVMATTHALGQTPVRPGRQVLVKRLQAMMAKGDHQKFAWGSGPCNSFAADLPTRKVWGAVMKCPPQGNQADLSYGYGGFKLDPLTSGAPLQGAKVAVTFEVSQILGAARLYAAAVAQGEGQAFMTEWESAPIKTIMAVTQPGTYVVETPVFTLEADKSYHAEAVVRLHTAACPEACLAVVKVTDLKWAF